MGPLKPDVQFFNCITDLVCKKQTIKAENPIEAIANDQTDNKAKKISTLADLSARIIIEEFDYNNLNTFPEPYQMALLSKTKNFTEWMELKSYLASDVVEESAKQILKAEGKAYSLVDRIHRTAQEKLLSVRFDEMIEKASEEEKEKIIKLKREATSTLNAASKKVLNTSEKIQKFVAKILTNPLFYIPVSIWAGYRTYKFGAFLLNEGKTILNSQVIPQTLSFLDKHSPATKNLLMGSWKFYENHKWKIILSAFFAPLCVPRTSILHRPVTWTSKAVFLPFTLLSKVSSFPRDIAWYLGLKINAYVPAVGKSWSELSGRQEAWRLRTEIVEAKQLWMNQIKTQVKPNETKSWHQRFSQWFTPIQPKAWFSRAKPRISNPQLIRA